jgi:hypothetical protein
MRTFSRSGNWGTGPGTIAPTLFYLTELHMHSTQTEPRVETRSTWPSSALWHLWGSQLSSKSRNTF